MKKLKSILIVALLVLLAAPVYPAQAQNQAAVKSQPQTPPKDERASPKAPRPIDVLDILAWKGISGTALSADGQWFAYRLSPMEGDGEVIIRQTKGAKEYKFPAGEGRFGPVSFSEDAKYCAFTVFPTAKEAKALRKEKKPVVTKAALVNLATGDKVEYEKIKNFAFSRENPAWLALLKIRRTAKPAKRTSGRARISSCGSWPRARNSCSATSLNFLSTRRANGWRWSSTHSA